jgi:hypothetical protein
MEGTEDGRMMSKEPPLRIITCKMPEEVHTRIKVLAANRKTTMAQVLIEFVTQGLKKVQAKEKKHE